MLRVMENHRCQRSCMVLRVGGGRTRLDMWCMLMGSQDQRLHPYGVVGCQQRSPLSIPVLCETIL
jgi:hypothetical protein